MSVTLDPHEIAIKDGNPIWAISHLSQQFHLLDLNNLYHYTSISGFISIMQKQELWASHVAFMNDKSEFIHGKELFMQEIQRRICNVPEEEAKLLTDLCQILEQDSSDGIFAKSSKDVYSLSFSYNDDSLEMWRGYAQSGGIAIGFDRKNWSSTRELCLIRKELYSRLLEKCNNNPEEVYPEHERLFFPQRVLYEPKEKEEFARAVIGLGLEHFRFILKRSPKIAFISGTQFMSDTIFSLIPLLKHNCFCAEKEYRFVENSVERLPEQKYHVHFRERNGIILPYIKYKLVDENCRPLKQLPICSIIVGPCWKQQKVVDSVKYFLANNNMDYLVDKVRASNLPYIDT